jgi:hypothetical protein
MPGIEFGIVDRDFERLTNGLVERSKEYSKEKAAFG